MEQQSGTVSDAHHLSERDAFAPSTDKSIESIAHHILNGWRLRPSENRLTKGAEEIRLEPKSMDLLLRLTAADGEAISRADLIAQLWPNLYASDDSLNQIVSRLRRSLAKDERLAKAVITVPKRGYRLDTSVVDVPEESAPQVQIPQSENNKADRISLWPFWVIGVAVVASIAVFTSIRSSAPEANEFASMRSSVLAKRMGHGAGAQISPNGEYVAYAWGRTGTQDLDIYVQRIGDLEPQVISQHDAIETGPIWSSDGRALMFVRSTIAGDCSIVRTDIATLSEEILHRCVAGRQVTLASAPTGDKIFVSDRFSVTDPFAVYEIDLEFGEARQVTFPEPMTFGDTNVRISPDGSEFAFVRSENYLDGNIIVADIKSGELSAATEGQKNITDLAWHRDGTHLIFATERGSAFGLWRTGKGDKTIAPIPAVLGDVTSVSSSKVSERIVYEAARINSKVETLSLNDTEFELESQAKKVSSFDRFPDISNDGARQVRISDRSSKPVLIVTDLESGDDHIIDIGVELIISASWSPDGKRLLVGGLAEKNFDLYLVTPDTGDVKRLTDHRASEYNPTWSLDGKRAYFTSNRTGRFEIWCLNIETGNGRQITFNGGHRAIEATNNTLFIAKKYEDGLFEVDLASPTVEEKLVTGKLSSLDWRNWDHAGAHIYYVVRDSETEVMLRRYNIKNGEDNLVRKIDELPLLSGLSVTPDEASVLVTKILSAETDLMMLDGFTGSSETKRTLQAFRENSRLFNRP